MNKKLLIVLQFVLFGSLAIYSQDKLSTIMLEELERNMSELKNEDLPPYYISLRANTINTYRLSSVYGSIVSNTHTNERYITTSVRVGDHELDNTREIRDEFGSWFSRRPVFKAPVEDEDIAIRKFVWKQINTLYVDAKDRHNQVLANIALKADDEDESDDFSKEKVYTNYSELPDISFNAEEWKERLNSYSKVLLKYPEIYDGQARLSYNIERRNFVSSEGSVVEENNYYAELFIMGNVKANDGMEMPLFTSYFAFSPDDIPDCQTIIQDIENMAKILVELKTAPIAEAYAGPAILTGEVAGVFFHEIFGHRIEGHRLKLSTDGQTFKNRVGERVLPEHLSVIFDPQKKTYKNTDMKGYYMFDDEGIKGQKVDVVKNGILKNFLMSRTPLEDFPNSNGHGRAARGQQVVSRQSNMFIKTNNPLSVEELREELIKELKEQEKEYGFYFTDVSGGFTQTGRWMPNAFNVSPLVVYKVYADGRDDELIRGVDLIGTPLAMFSQIVSAADDYGFFHGMCGAESGSVPVTTVSPSLLVRQIETQRKFQSHDRPFILPPPNEKE